MTPTYCFPDVHRAHPTMPNAKAYCGVRMSQSDVLSFYHLLSCFLLVFAQGRRGGGGGVTVTEVANT